MIEKTLEALQIKALETKTEEQRLQEKSREYQVKQAEFNEYVRRYAELQMKVEAENRRIEAARSFAELINNMSYSLNGIPRWPIAVIQPPPEKRLDETAYVQRVVRQRDNAQLLDRVFLSPENESKVSKRPPIDPRLPFRTFAGMSLRSRKCLYVPDYARPPVAASAQLNPLRYA